MLALSRKENESVMIGNDIEVTILEIKSDQVKLGIKAPRSVSIYREEIYLQIQQANREAAEAKTPAAGSLEQLFS
ncbi:MAG: carbon storage regulator CsrA [Lachnospiraceae bacterium]|jgi:carbon storage regulator|nr:carbon storage regulator CsrA [Lachnospiraceae bacterium]MCX4317729.1 carbon storage regulator CsrA [Lachnospiraceae bacterium]